MLHSPIPRFTLLLLSSIPISLVDFDTLFTLVLPS